MVITNICMEKLDCDLASFIRDANGHVPARSVPHDNQVPNTVAKYIYFPLDDGAIGSASTNSTISHGDREEFSLDALIEDDVRPGSLYQSSHGSSTFDPPWICPLIMLHTF